MRFACRCVLSFVAQSMNASVPCLFRRRQKPSKAVCAVLFLAGVLLVYLYTRSHSSTLSPSLTATATVDAEDSEHSLYEQRPGSACRVFSPSPSGMTLYAFLYLPALSSHSLPSALPVLSSSANAK